MTRNMVRIFFLNLVSLLVLAQFCRASDWEYWSHYEVKVPVRERIDFQVKPEIRFKENMTHLHLGLSDFGLDWKLKDWLIVAPYYRYLQYEKNEEWKIEHRPHLNLTFVWKALTLKFSDRSRLVYRIKEGKNSFRFRNKFTVKFPKLTEFKIQPYLADEIFYDFEVNELNKNRVYVGLSFGLIKNLQGSLYYILQSSKKTDWENINVLGTTLKYCF